MALRAEIAKLQCELEKARGLNSECMERNAQLEAELTAMKAEKTELETKATDPEQETVEMNDATDGLVAKMRAENAHFRSELNRLSYILRRRDAEFDDVHGRLKASRYYINYLQNRPEFQNIRKDEYLPPDMRRKSSAVGEKAKSKKVHFADTVDICEYQKDGIFPGFNSSNSHIQAPEGVVL